MASAQLLFHIEVQVADLGPGGWWPTPGVGALV